MTALQFHTMDGGEQIAFRHLPADAAAITMVFLPGYMSDMDGSKASACWAFAQENGIGCLLLDYSGCGKSDGDFADGSLSLWRDQILALISVCRIDRPLLIGSSMGGWLMLLVALALGSKVAGMVGIAAAPDFSDWGYSDDQKALLAAGQTVFEDNPYGPDPTPTFAKFWQDGQAHRLLDHTIEITCPVRLLHGKMDADVPWQTSMRLSEQIRSDDIQLTLVKDGDHRLSRGRDIALLLRQIAGLLG